MVEEQFEKGTKVWAKIKGHPWWPAQVADQADLSQLVLGQKPKRPSHYVPVLFYGTNNYGWLQSDAIRHFDDPAVEENLGRKTVALTNAIQRARADESPDGKLKIFDDDGNSDFDGENDDEEMGDGKNEEGGEEDDEEENIPVKSSTRKPKSTRKTPAKTPATERKSKNGKRKAGTDETPSKRKRGEKSRRDESEESRDHDDDEDAEEQETHKKKASKSKTPSKAKKNSKRSEEQATEELEKKKEKTRSDHDQLMYFRHKIQKMMKESPENLASSPKIDGIMAEVESFPMTLNLLKDTKMGKLMKRMSQIKFTEDSYGIKERTHRLMKRWKNDFAENVEKDTGSEETELKKTAEETSLNEKDEKENHCETPVKDPITATTTPITSASVTSPIKKKEVLPSSTSLEDSGTNLQKSTTLEEVGSESAVCSPIKEVKESGICSPVKESGIPSPVKESSGIRSPVKESNGNLFKQEPAVVSAEEKESTERTVNAGSDAEENMNPLTAE